MKNSSALVYLCELRHRKGIGGIGNAHRQNLDLEIGVINATSIDL